MTAPATSTTHDLFISYAEADRAWVDGFLLDALDQATVNYHTEDAFALGVPRLIEFERAIAQSKRTLLVLSPAYLADTFGQFVDVLVNSYGMETATWPVIPLLLQPVDLPPRLTQLIPLDATNPETQQAALERLCAQLQRPVPSLAPLPACPYPGMVPFDEADSERFFGREAEVQDLVERLRLHPFIAVIGASGSGKSSLVRAGLIPALRKSRLFGGNATQGQTSEWMVKIIRPGATPLAALAAAIEIDERLAAQPEAPRLLLVVDQFEELFTLAGEEAQPFQQTLQKLAAAPGCYVVLTARADFYSNMMASPLWPQIQAHRMELMPITDAGLRRAIVQPAERVHVFVETALVERLLADAADEPGVLPLIQETLVLLWEKLERRFLPMRAYDALVLTRGAYAGDGERTGLQVAIARRADATFASLAAEQQPIARRIFLRLIQFGEGRADTRRQQPVAALQSAGDDPALFEATLRHLTDSRLLTLSGEAAIDERRKTKDEQLTTDDGAPSSSVLRPSSVKVDIAHEALIRGWPLLQGWLNERRDAEQIRRRLEGKAAEWVRLGKGDGGLLDAVEVVEAERWLESADADEMGFDEALPALAIYSRAALEAQEQEQEAARQRELAQAQALAEEQRQRAEQQRLRAEEQVAAGKQLRQRAVFLAGALVVALVTTIAAVAFLLNSQQKTQEALVQKGLADSAKATAETSAALALAAEAQTRAQLLSVRGQREAVEQPLLGLRLALEGLTSVPANAGGARGQLADAVVELARTGRVLRVSDDIQTIFKSPDGAHFVLARAQAPGELRRSSDGALLATLTSQIQSPSNVAAVSDVALAAEGVHFSPDATAAIFIAYYADKNAELRRSADGKLLLALQEQLPLVIFSPGQATYFVVVYTGYPAELRRSADGALIKQLDPEATNATFSTDSTASVFVIRYNDPKVAELRRSADGALLAQLTDSLSQDPIWSPDPAATYFVVNYGFLGVSDENGVELRRSADGKLLRTMTTSDSSILFSKNSAATYMILYTGESYELRRSSDGELVPLPDGATSVTFSEDPSSTYLVVDYDDKPTELRTIVGGAVVQLPGKLFQTEYSPDPLGTYFVSSYEDHPTEVRHTADGRLLATLKDQSGDITFSPDPAASYFVVTYHSGQPSELHRSSDGALLATIPAPEQSNSVQVQFPATQAGVFALGYDDKPAELRRIPDGELVAELPDQQRLNNIIHFGIPRFDSDPSGSVFVVRYSGARAELRSAMDGAVLGTFTGSVSDVTFSPSNDAKVFVLRYSDKPAELWDWNGKPRLLASLGFGADNYFFDPQGQHLIVPYSGGRAYLLDIVWLQAMQGELTQLPEAELIRLACQETRLRRRRRPGDRAISGRPASAGVSMSELPELPALFSQLTDLERLDLSGKQLAALPEYIGGLTRLTCLMLDDNQLLALPDSLGALANLRWLALDGNALADLPATVGALTRLERLDARRNQFAVVPESLSRLANLRDLRLGKNLLTSLPEWLWQLANLETLDLSENRLSSVPASISGLTRLWMLDLGHNQLAAIPETIGELPNLAGYLYLSDNRMTALPESLGNLHSLAYLNATDNQLTSLPVSLGGLAGLVELRLYNNHLAALPESLGKLVNLRELHLQNNALRSLPEAIGGLVRLRKLNLSGNQLARLPESLGDLTRLVELDLRNNRLVELPVALGNATNLTYLDLRGNKLRSLPASIAELPNLEKLDLRWNKLAGAHASLKEIERRGCVVLR